MLCFIQSKMIHQGAIACVTSMGIRIRSEPYKPQHRDCGEDDPDIEFRLLLIRLDAGEDMHDDRGYQHNSKNREIPADAHHQDGQSDCGDD